MGKAPRQLSIIFVGVKNIVKTVKRGISHLGHIDIDSIFKVILPPYDSV